MFISSSSSLSLLLLLVSATNVFGRYLTDLTLPSSNMPEETVTKYEDCRSKRKYFFQDQCWDLLTRGPCDEGQWLVLEQFEFNNESVVKCARRKCSDPDQYWPTDRFCYDAKTAHRHKLCPQPNTELVTNKYGDGYCGCRKDDQVPYVKVGSADGEDENSQPCYLLYTRGPCPMGKVLTSSEWGYGRCTTDQCTVERLQGSLSPLELRLGLQQQQQQQQRQRQTYQAQKYQHQQYRHQQSQQLQQPIVVPWTDGKCYELGTQGPCNDDEEFVVLQDTMRPNCTNTAVELALLEEGCIKNHAGKCQEEIKIQTTTTPRKKHQSFFDQFDS